jgi:hypothetical protein
MCGFADIILPRRWLVEASSNQAILTDRACGLDRLDGQLSHQKLPVHSAQGEMGQGGEGGGYQDGIDRHCERSEAIRTAAPRWIASSLRSSQ